MGWRFEVAVWTDETGTYDYKIVYKGNNLLKMFWVGFKVRAKYGAIRFVIR